MTVSVPFMPAAACPGTVQRKVYLPGFRSTVAFAVEAVIVFVPPSAVPLASSIWTLWPTGESLVKSIVSLPAAAVMLVSSNLS